MERVKFMFSKDDIEMKEDLEKEFGKDLQYSEEFDFIGGTIAIYVLPATALAFQILDFVLTHMVNKDKAKEKGKESVKKERKVEVDGQRISLYEYSADEVIKILSKLGIRK